MDGKDILTVAQVAEQYPAFTEKTIRWWIYNRKTNGFRACIIRIGKRIFIDRVKFTAWLETHRPPPDVLGIDD